MRRRGRASSRAWSVAAAVAALALGGCGAQPAATGLNVSGKTLRVYISAPPAGQRDARAQDVLDAEQLAFKLQSSSITAFTVRDQVISAAKASDNARTAIQDGTTIAYLGEILPGASADSLGILNSQDILTVSPTDTAVELTQTSSAVADSPSTYYESLGTYGHTFARVVPTTLLEAKAIVSELSAEQLSHVYVANDGQPYGRALAAALKQAAGASVSVATGAASASAVQASGAQALVYAGASATAAKTLFDAVAAASPSIKLFAPSALADQGFAGSLSSAASAALRVSSPGFTAAALPAAGKGFVTAFTSAYGHAPSAQAIFGYEAMSAVLAVIHEAGSAANNRSTVQKDFVALRNRASVLGSYSINVNGDTSLAPFVISQVKSGQLVATRFVSEQG